MTYREFVDMLLKLGMTLGRDRWDPFDGEIKLTDNYEWLRYPGMRGMRVSPGVYDLPVNPNLWGDVLGILNCPLEDVPLLLMCELPKDQKPQVSVIRELVGTARLEGRLP